MRLVSSKAKHVVPLLFRYATPRKSSADLPGYYDRDAQLWMIKTCKGLVPVVEAANSTVIPTNTSTRVQQERDDEGCSNRSRSAALDLAGTTVTVVQVEADDQDASTDLRSFEALLDTSTVTKVRQEGADDDLTGDETLATRRRLDSLTELATKTEVQQESDDQMNVAEIFELETRSLNNHEGVDHDFPGMLLELQTKTSANVEGDDDDLSLIH